MRFLYKTIFVGAIPCLAAAVLVILMLTGCATVGPDYIPPDTPVSAREMAPGEVKTLNN